MAGLIATPLAPGPLVPARSGPGSFPWHTVFPPDGRSRRCQGLAKSLWGCLQPAAMPSFCTYDPPVCVCHQGTSQRKSIYAISEEWRKRCLRWCETQIRAALGPFPAGRSWPRAPRGVLSPEEPRLAPPRPSAGLCAASRLFPGALVQGAKSQCSGPLCNCAICLEREKRGGRRGAHVDRWVPGRWTMSAAQPGGVWSSSPPPAPSP